MNVLNWKIKPKNVPWVNSLVNQKIQNNFSYVIRHNSIILSKNCIVFVNWVQHIGIPNGINIQMCHSPALSLVYVQTWIKHFFQLNWWCCKLLTAQSIRTPISINAHTFIPVVSLICISQCDRNKKWTWFYFRIFCLVCTTKRGWQMERKKVINSIDVNS